MSTFTLLALVAAAAWVLWLGCRGVWHTAAYYGSLGAGPVQCNALSDDILRIDQTNGFMMPNDMLLLYSYLTSALILRGYLSSPKILQTNPLYIRPVASGPGTPYNPPISWWGPNYLTLRGQEDVLLNITNSGAGPSATYGIIGVAPQIDPLPAGQIYTVYGTSTTTATAHAWTTVTLTLGTALPAGQYALVGSDVQSATGVAHRWIIPNQFWRPGFTSSVALTDQPSWLRLNRTLGLMGYFFQYNLPQLQVLCNAADAAFDVYLDLIKVA